MLWSPKLVITLRYVTYMKTLKPLSNTNHAIKLQGVFLNELPTENPKNDHNPFGKLQLLEMQLYVDLLQNICVATATSTATAVPAGFPNSTSNFFGVAGSRTAAANFHILRSITWPPLRTGTIARLPNSTTKHWALGTV